MVAEIISTSTETTANDTMDVSVSSPSSLLASNDMSVVTTESDHTPTAPMRNQGKLPNSTCFIAIYIYTFYSINKKHKQMLHT